MDPPAGRGQAVVLGGVFNLLSDNDLQAIFSGIGCKIRTYGERLFDGVDGSLADWAGTREQVRGYTSVRETTITSQIRSPNRALAWVWTTARLGWSIFWSVRCHRA